MLEEKKNALYVYGTGFFNLYEMCPQMGPKWNYV